MINKVYKIEIDDLTIRCYEKDDVLKLKEAIDVSMDHLHRFMLWSHHEPESIESKTERTLGWRKDFLKNIDYVYGVFRGEKLVASTGLHTNFDDKALEIGYWVRADETRKGIATKLSCALTIAAMEIIKVDRVEIRYEIENRLKLAGNQQAVKILEIGSGTGGTSVKVLEQIATYAAQVTYCYTDISMAFVLFPFLWRD